MVSRHSTMARSSLPRASQRSRQPSMKPRSGRDRHAPLVRNASNASSFFPCSVKQSARQTMGLGGHVADRSNWPPTASRRLRDRFLGSSLLGAGNSRGYSEPSHFAGCKRPYASRASPHCASRKSDATRRRQAASTAAPDTTASIHPRQAPRREIVRPIDAPHAPGQRDRQTNLTQIGIAVGPGMSTDLTSPMTGTSIPKNHSQPTSR